MAKDLKDQLQTAQLLREAAAGRVRAVRVHGRVQARQPPRRQETLEDLC